MQRTAMAWVAFALLAGCLGETPTADTVPDLPAPTPETHTVLYSAQGSGTVVENGVVSLSLNARQPPPFSAANGSRIVGFTLDLTEQSPVDGSTFTWTLRCEVEARACSGDGIVGQASGPVPLYLEAGNLSLPAKATVVIDVQWERTVPNTDLAGTGEDSYTISGRFVVEGPTAPERPA